MGFTAQGAQSALGFMCGNYHNMWLGFSTTKPTEEGTNFTEPTGASYKRVKLVGSGSTSGVRTYSMTSSGHVLYNVEAIYMPEPTENWGTLKYFGLFPSETSSTPDYIGVLKNAQGTDDGVTVNTGYILFIRIGELEVTLDAPEG